MFPQRFPLGSIGKRGKHRYPILRGSNQITKERSPKLISIVHLNAIAASAAGLISSSYWRHKSCSGNREMSDFLQPTFASLRESRATAMRLRVDAAFRRADIQELRTESERLIQQSRQLMLQGRTIHDLCDLAAARVPLCP
jgi:hypothetical protein